MSIEKFNHFKDRFHNTAPIRGRAVECRPIAKRSRDWEQVVKRYIVDEGVLDVEGGEAYGAHLYQTDCVMYTSHGDMYLRTGGYETPTTADFINRYIPGNMHCYKKYNKIWITYQDQSYVMGNGKPLIFRFNKDTESYTVENPTQLQQKVVDRTKAKEARKPIEAFRNYVKIMLKLADGWLSNELVELHAEPHTGYRDYWGRRNYKLDGQDFTGYGLSGSLSQTDAHKVYTAMSTEDDTQFPKLLCMITAGSNSLDNRVIRTETEDYVDYQGNPQQRTHQVREYRYDYKTVDNRINYIVKQGCDVYTTKAVAMGVVATNLI